MTTQNAILTTRFGELRFEPTDVLNFAQGLVGLPALKRFVLIQHSAEGPFFWLQSLDEGTVAFLVTDPNNFVSGFDPEMPESASAALELTAESSILVYTVCNIPKGNPQGMTLNLAGPIVVNADSRQARQVVLDDATYPVRYAAFQEDAEKAA